jgi:internalin A
LVSLDLSKNQLTDVNGLEKLTQLTVLGLKDNPDLTKAQITELQKALPKCKIHSNLPLTKEESAQVVEAVIRKKLKKPIGELTKADLTKVTRLDIRDNGLTDVKGLEKLTQLTSLDLRDNKLTDVKVLEKLTQLTYLDLSNNPDLTTAQINQLKKTMPKCLIGSNPTK